ncbi:MAG: family 78 glycoside hydrolase catalytic domain [Acidobacteria bacterium]|nr:family 78 glycoside hydrolase catalytic domain [Acidobacteriota bacterium]
MARIPVRVLAVLGLAGVSLAVCAQGTVSVGGLRCEYLADPQGIDVEKPRLTWMLAPGPNGRGQSAYRILAASGLDKLRKDQGDVWDSGQVKSAQTAWVEYGGRPLASGERIYWKVRAWDEGGRPSAWSGPARWSMGVLKDAEWHARTIGMARPADGKEGTPQPFPWLRKTFDLKRKPARATAYVNPLGYYELYVNGKKVDDHVLSPAVSDYSKRTYYVTHDITDYLAAGTNCVALWLGRGWYVRKHPGVIHDGPLVRAQFDIAMPGGEARTIGTDATWKVKASPITPLGRGTAFGDYGGERYDAGLELAGWNSAALDDSSWAAAAVFDPPKTTTAAQMVEPNRILETIPAVKIEEKPPGEWQIDFGKNFVGWLELKLPEGAEAGANLRIDYADWTPAPGRWGTYNQRDEYVTKAGAQTVRSRFNYHGFQYAHVTGLKRKPALGDVKGFMIRTSYAKVADFESSNELLNRIYRTVNWTYENLSLGGYVVDCPTRERLGYGGDAGTSLETALFNFDTGGLYTRWAENWRDAQASDGDLPYTAPNYQDQGGGGPMWCGFVVTMPWQVYLTYGDRRALETNYPLIRKWLEFAESKTVGHILEPYLSTGMKMAQWNYLGDWVTPRRATGGADLARHPVSAKFINNLHYLYTLQLAVKIARVLGHPEDAALCERRAATLAATLHEKFWDPYRGVYATGEQPYLAMPLLLNVTPADLRPPVMKTLEQTILERNQGHIDAGMHGAYFLLKYLMEQDRNDLIFTMANQTTFPGWGHMLQQGATTIWESWSGGSHIHDCLIAIGSWFIQGIGGIRIDEASPGFRHFLIQPAVAGDLTFARARYRSIHGEIASSWRLENGTFRLDVTVPPGTTATVLLPAAGPGQGRKAIEVQSGSHSFSTKFR